MQNVQQPKRAVAYYRSASLNGNAILKQREAVRHFAKKQGINILHEEIDNGFPGTDTNRPGFSRLCKEWIYNRNAPAFEFVLMMDRARLLRSTAPNKLDGLVTTIRSFKKEIVFIDEPEPKDEF